MRRLRIGIQHCCDHSPDLVLLNEIHARRRAPLVVAGLEVDVEGCARRLRARLPERHHFGMRAAGLFVPALADDGLALRDHAADARIGRGAVQTFAGKLERPRHHGAIERRKGAHFLRFLVLTSWTASRKSSGVSKLR